MVDLHSNGPRMAEGHRWLELGRWGMAWRVTLGCLFVGMLGITALGLFGVGRPASPNLLAEQFFRAAFGIFPAAVFGLLAVFIGPWLRRFFPFTQGILFGLIGAASVCITLFCLGFSLVLLFGWCTPSNDCFSFDQLLLFPIAVLMYAGLPLALMGGLGLGVAIMASNSRRARYVFAAALVLAVVLYTVF